MPERIQLSRAKGWRMPPNTVRVARPGPFGNPFKVADLRELGCGGSDAVLARICVETFRAWLGGADQDWMGPESEACRTAMLARMPELHGKNLACWCPLGSPCHADVLLELANA